MDAVVVFGCRAWLFVVELERNASKCTLLCELWLCVPIGRLQWLQRTMVVLI